MFKLDTVLSESYAFHSDSELCKSWFTFTGLGSYTHEDTWILYDIGLGAVINGVAILGHFVGLRKLKDLLCLHVHVN